MIMKTLNQQLLKMTIIYKNTNVMNECNAKPHP